MPNRHLTPRRYGDLDGFEANFITKFPGHAAALSIDSAEVERSMNLIKDHRTAYASMLSKRGELRSATADNFSKRKVAKKELVRLASVIKSQRLYNTSIGEDLGIIGTEKLPIDYAEVKPVLNAKVIGPEVAIRFFKQGTDGIKFYSKRTGEKDFTYIGVATRSPYKDGRSKLTANQPEQREYFAAYFSYDKEVGKRSDIIKVVLP